MKVMLTLHHCQLMMKCVQLINYVTLHKKWSFSLKISSVNVTNSTASCRFTEEVLNGKLHFLCIVRHDQDIWKPGWDRFHYRSITSFCCGESSSFQGLNEIWAILQEQVYCIFIPQKLPLTVLILFSTFIKITVSRIQQEIKEVFVNE